VTNEPAPSAENFTGRRVLVTGGSRGLGRATAVAYLNAGAVVTACARREPEEPVTAGDRTAHFVAADVRDTNAIPSMVTKAAELMGGIDILINNAGGSPGAAAADSRGSFNEKIIGLNLVGPMNVSIVAHEHLAKSDHGGVIINIASISGMRANPMGVAYGAAKAGLINMSQTLALEWGPAIRVLTVSAGPLMTDANADHFDRAERERLASSMALQRMGTSTDVVEAILFATSDRASWMSGSNIVVDGGPEWPANGHQRR